MKSAAACCVLCVAAVNVADAFVTNSIPPTAAAARTALNAEPFEGTVVVCTGGSCTRNGGKKARALFEEFAGENVEVETISCVSECAECALGPNVELRAKGDSGPFYPIKNKVKNEDDVKAILGIEK